MGLVGEGVGAGRDFLEVCPGGGYTPRDWYVRTRFPSPS
jgi:hypothetical protein